MRPLETSTEWRRDDFVEERFLSRVDVDRVIGGVLNIPVLRDLGAGVLGTRSALSDDDPFDDFSSFSGADRFDLSDLDFDDLFSSLRGVPAVHMFQDDDPSRFILGRSLRDLDSEEGSTGASGTAGGTGGSSGAGGGGGGGAEAADFDFFDFLGFSGESTTSTNSSSLTSVGKLPGSSFDFFDLRFDSDGGAGGGGGGGTSMNSSSSSTTSKALSLSAILPPTAFRDFAPRDVDCPSMS